MMTAIALSFRQLLHPATLRLVLLVAVVTLLLLLVLGALGGWFVSTWLMPLLPADGTDGLVALALMGLYVLGAFFLFRSVAVAVMGLFTDGIVASVEEEHYPDAAARARHVSFRTGLRLGLAVASVSLLVGPAAIFGIRVLLRKVRKIMEMEMASLADAPFSRLGVPVSLVAVLHSLDIREPFPIQAETLPDSLAGRIEDCQSTIVITADEGLRGGRAVPLKSNVDNAIRTPAGSGVKTVIVVRRTGGSVNWEACQSSTCGTT